MEQDGILKYANSYLCSRGMELITHPEEKVRDGKISEVRLRNFTISFYKAVPAIPENKQKLEDIFHMKEESWDNKF